MDPNAWSTCTYNRLGAGGQSSQQPSDFPSLSAAMEGYHRNPPPDLLLPAHVGMGQGLEFLAASSHSSAMFPGSFSSPMSKSLSLVPNLVKPPPSSPNAPFLPPPSTPSAWKQSISSFEALGQLQSQQRMVADKQRSLFLSEPHYTSLLMNQSSSLFAPQNPPTSTTQSSMTESPTSLSQHQSMAPSHLSATARSPFSHLQSAHYFPTKPSTPCPPPAPPSPSPHPPHSPRKEHVTTQNLHSSLLPPRNKTTRAQMEAPLAFMGRNKESSQFMGAPSKQMAAHSPVPLPSPHPLAHPHPTSHPHPSSHPQPTPTMQQPQQQQQPYPSSTSASQQQYPTFQRAGLPDFLRGESPYPPSHSTPPQPSPSSQYNNIQQQQSNNQQMAFMSSNNSERVGYPSVITRAHNMPETKQSKQQQQQYGGYSQMDPNQTLLEDLTPAPPRATPVTHQSYPPHVNPGPTPVSLDDLADLTGGDSAELLNLDDIKVSQQEEYLKKRQSQQRKKSPKKKETVLSVPMLPQYHRTPFDHYMPYPSPNMQPAFPGFSPYPPPPTTTNFQPVPTDSRVITPRIEDEMAFLAAIPIEEVKVKPVCKPGGGFMDSYMRFLKGDSDEPSSPQPAPIKKLYVPPPPRPPPPPPQTTITPVTVTKTSTSPSRSISPEFVIRKKGGSPITIPPFPKESGRRPGRPSSTNKSESHRTEKSESHHRSEKGDKESKETKEPKESKSGRGGKRGRGKKKVLEEPPAPPPSNGEEKKEKPPPSPAETPSMSRRESSRRKAKEKVVAAYNIEDEEYLADDPDALQDSDSDPAWTPYAVKDSSDDEANGRKRGRRSTGRLPSIPGSGRTKRSRVAQDDDYDVSPPPRPTSNKSSEPSNPVSSVPEVTPAEMEEFENTFKSGEFVVLKAEIVSAEQPSIWRIDGRTLLQKYEPYEEGGKVQYKNISTYSGWTIQNRHLYQLVPVRYLVQNRTETVVELLKDKIVLEPDKSPAPPSKDESTIYQESFEVYVQTLISQALDANFLNEIFQEKDDYFVSNVKKIDDVTDKRRRDLARALGWGSKFEASAGAWPCFNVIRLNSSGGLCEACGGDDPSKLVQMFGQPYDGTTLQSREPSSDALDKKEYVVCVKCSERVPMYNQVAHQKYHFYVKCMAKVSSKRGIMGHEATTAILKDLLADEEWLQQLFREIQSTWTEVDRLINSARKS